MSISAQRYSPRGAILLAETNDSIYTCPYNESGHASDRHTRLREDMVFILFYRLVAIVVTKVGHNAAGVTTVSQQRRPDVVSPHSLVYSLPR